MAKKSGAGTIIEIIIGLVAVYLVFRWMAGRSSAPGSMTTGNGGGTTYAAYPAGGSNGNLANAFQQLAQTLGGMLGGGRRSGVSMGFSPSSGAGSLFSSLGSGLQSAISAISNYSTIANTMPLAELGGQSLASYDTGITAGGPISYYPLQTDPNLPTFPIDTGASGLGGDLGGISTTSYDTGSIPLDPLSNFDVSQLASPASDSSNGTWIGGGGGDLAPSDFTAFDALAGGGSAGDIMDASANFGGF